MTYGDNAGVIRDELTALLRHHRIQERLGGPGSYTIPQTTTIAERAELGRIIKRYQHVTLTWCRLAVEAVSPKTDIPATPRDRTPVEELRRTLRRSLAPQSGLETPLSDLLAMNHSFELLARWQATARSAALGEHDFATDVNLSHLTIEQARTVAKDAADIIRGVLILDRRYNNIPGWTELPQSGRLARAAEIVSRAAGGDELDLSVDTRGWRPPDLAIAGPHQPGLAGVLQAQHNTLTYLTHAPNALNLRRLLHSQAQISHEAAKHAGSAPALADRFKERAYVYTTLLRQSRDLGGLIGHGGAAVAESQNALARLRRTPVEPTEKHQRKLAKLGRLFTRTDARMTSLIERGCDSGSYLRPVNALGAMEPGNSSALPARAQWVPVRANSESSELVSLVRRHLRPAQVQRIDAARSSLNRENYQIALSHRPPTRPGLAR